MTQTLSSPVFMWRNSWKKVKISKLNLFLIILKIYRCILYIPTNNKFKLIFYIIYLLFIFIIYYNLINIFTRYVDDFTVTVRLPFDKAHDLKWVNTVVYVQPEGKDEVEVKIIYFTLYLKRFMH